MTMRRLTERQRWILSNALLYVGFIGALLTFVTSFALIIYYSYARPQIPRPDLGLTVRLPWTWAYGSWQERERLVSLHWWNIAFVFPAGAGMLLRKKWQLDRGPWLKR